MYVGTGYPKHGEYPFFSGNYTLPNLAAPVYNDLSFAQMGQMWIYLSTRKAIGLKPLQLVFTYARRYKLVLIITVISMFLLVGAQLLVPEAIRRLIKIVTASTVTPSSFRIVNTLALAVLGVYIVRAGMRFLRSYMAHLAGWGVVADVRKHIYEHLQALSLRYYEDKQTGQLMSRVINDTELFEQLISHAVPDVVVNLITLIGVSVILLFINWRLTLLSMIPIPLVIISLKV
jgi:ATP-binding cassette subfamily B protein/subfamily B ATP-binding cassette protein MsbA